MPTAIDACSFNQSILIIILPSQPYQAFRTGACRPMPCLPSTVVRVQATPPLAWGPSALCNPPKVQPELPFRALRLDPIQQGVGSIGVPSLILLTGSYCSVHPLLISTLLLTTNPHRHPNWHRLLVGATNMCIACPAYVIPSPFQPLGQPYVIRLQEPDWLALALNHCFSIPLNYTSQRTINNHASRFRPTSDRCPSISCQEY